MQSIVKNMYTVIYTVNGGEHQVCQWSEGAAEEIDFDYQAELDKDFPDDLVEIVKCFWY